jgi:hypothetical protein
MGLAFLTLLASPTWSHEPVLRLAVFEVDATPPMGSPVAYARVRSIVDPLYAKGIVLLPQGEAPVVITVFDWIGIANGGQDWWREAIASAVGTQVSRVAVHTVHQHDGPRWDTSALSLIAEPQQAAAHFDAAFVRQVRDRLLLAIDKAIVQSRPVTHVGTGKAKVEQVASNRRLLGPDGKVATMRFSSCTDPQAIAAPEGLIDPFVRLVSLWHGDEALVSLAYYATHPMSYYGQGDVSSDFVGLARQQRQRQTGVPHIYFTGAGGNVAAGKYNNGQPEVRPVLARRLARAMATAWDATTTEALSVDSFAWRSAPVKLPPAPHLQTAALRSTLENPDTSDQERLAAASHLAWLERCEAGQAIDLTCLQIGSACIVHMPGELFVEYALAAARMCPDQFVCMAAYGDYGPGYIGTEVSYTQGGYETSARASRVAPRVESVLLSALDDLLHE